MMRKVKVKRPKKSSTLTRMEVPKLELPTAQFGDQIIGPTSQPDPGNIRSETKEKALDRRASKAPLGERVKEGTKGFLTGFLASIPIVGGAFKGLNENVLAKDDTGAAGVGSFLGKVPTGIASATLSGGTTGTGTVLDGVGDLMDEGASEIAYNKGNDKKSERLAKAGQAFDTIAPIADMASGFAGGAEGAEGMFKGPEGFKGGMKTLLGGMPTAKFGTKLPLEMELMPEGGKMVDGYLHEEGGVITKHRGKAVAEIEGGEGITKIREEGKEEEKKGGVVYSNTTINSETGNTFSKDAKKWIESKDKSEIGVNTGRLELERLYKLQEEEKINQGLVNRGEEMAMKKYKKGGSLKAIPSDNKGLPQLPESVRNQMGYMKSGGGLYANIHAKRERIRKGSGESMRKPGTEGAPTNKDFERAKRTAKETAMYGRKLNLPKMQDGDNILLNLNKTDQNMDWNLPQVDVETPINNNEVIVGKSALPMDLSLLRKNKTENSNASNTEEKKDGKDRKGNLTPGDIKQLAAGAIPAAANLAAIPGILKNTAPRGKDRSITREQKLSNSGKERKTRQIFAALNNADISDARKATAAVRANEAIQDIGQATDTTNAQLALTKDNLDKETYKFNITQGDLTKVDKQTRKDLAITTGLTGAEQVATNLGNYGGLENNNLTIQAQLKVLKEAFPDFTITTDNMKSFIKALSTGKEEEIYKYRT